MWVSGEVSVVFMDWTMEKKAYIYIYMKWYVVLIYRIVVMFEG